MTAPLLICTDFALILPFMIAVESITIGPFTSISPFTAPAITPEVPVISPNTTVPRPTFTLPSLMILPSILSVFTYTSAAEVFPFTLPVIDNLPKHSTSPFTVPNTSSAPSEEILPLITVPF